MMTRLLDSEQISLRKCRWNRPVCNYWLENSQSEGETELYRVVGDEISQIEQCPHVKVSEILKCLDVME